MLADSPGHEQVLVPVGVEQGGMLLGQPNAERQREECSGRKERRDTGAPHVGLPCNRARSAKNPAVSAMR